MPTTYRSACSAMKLANKIGRPSKVRSVNLIYSFTKSDFNFKDKKDVAKALNYVKGNITKVYGKHIEAILFPQFDGTGHQPHIHAVIANKDLNTGSPLTTKRKTFKDKHGNIRQSRVNNIFYVREIADKEAKKYQISPVTYNGEHSQDYFHNLSKKSDRSLIIKVAKRANTKATNKTQFRKITKEFGILTSFSNKYSGVSFGIIQRYNNKFKTRWYRGSSLNSQETNYKNINYSIYKNKSQKITKKDLNPKYQLITVPIRTWTRQKAYIPSNKGRIYKPKPLITHKTYKIAHYHCNKRIFAAIHRLLKYNNVSNLTAEQKYLKNEAQEELGKAISDKIIQNQANKEAIAKVNAINKADMLEYQEALAKYNRQKAIDLNKEYGRSW